LVFAIFDGSGNIVEEWKKAALFPLSYILTLSFGVWFYDIKNKSSKPQQNLPPLKNEL
jgi:hypothetical protein